MNVPRREAIASETRRLLTGFCCSFGGLAGVWTAIWSLPVSEHHGGIGSDLVALAPPVLVHLGLGLCAGAAAALAILLAAPGTDEAEGKASSGP
jgi:hypothetical protein